MPLKKFVVRIVIASVLSFLAIALPLIFIMRSSLQEESQNHLIILISILNIALLSAIVYWHYRSLIVPIKKINESATLICDGNFETRIKLDPYDSDVKKLAESFNTMASEFENLEQMRKSFVANASHELRSPLTAMQGFLQAILDGTIAETDQKKYLEIVFSETKRLSHMINSMLDLSRMESGKYPLSFSKFDLNEIMRRIVIRFEPSLLKKALQLDVDFVPGQCIVFADREKIEQVIINLIDNAIKYSHINSRIFVSTHIHQRKAYVSVKDKGFGISKKEQMLIWDRFFMSDKARTPGREKGTGLGLSIVKKIIDEHKEVIWVESDKGQGATFIFTIALFDPAKHKLPENHPSQRRSTMRPPV